MNKKQRKELERIASLLEELRSDLETIRDEEDEKLDNIPDNLNGSDRYNDMWAVRDNLEEVIDDLDNTINNLRDNVIDF